MSKKENEKSTCDCDENCTCGCQDGEACTCNDEKCSCGCHDHVKNCGCLDGEECTCGDNCDCGEECDCGCHSHEKNCGCLDGEECTCGDNCDCGEHCECDDNCDCGCHDPQECDCDDEHCNCNSNDPYEIIKQYEKAFSQFEQALVKVDSELQATKKQAEDNERLAITFKKDLERFKERTKEEQENMKIAAITDIADELIPILDNFEQALKITGDPSVMKGFEMIEGMLKNAVKALGIEEIDAQNQEFDPNLHNAVGKKKTKDKTKANKIATVYQKGYKMANSSKVIRHSMVEIYLCD